MKYKSQQPEPMLKPYTLSELAKIYSISNPVMKKWLMNLQPELGDRTGRFYSARQVSLIFERLGIPQKVPVNAFEE